jgi:hypothetical protein
MRNARVAGVGERAAARVGDMRQHTRVRQRRYADVRPRRRRIAVARDLHVEGLAWPLVIEVLDEVSKRACCRSARATPSCSPVPRHCDHSFHSIVITRSMGRDHRFHAS